MTKQIQNTTTYKNLSLGIQQVILRRQNRLVIEHGYTVATNIGVEQWEKQSNYSRINYSIIKELLELNKL